MSETTRNRLISALRQYRHNDDNSPDMFNPEQGFALGYDKEEVDKLVGELQADNEALREQLKRQAKAAKMGMDAAKQAGESMYQRGEKMLAESNQEALDSERAANALLTEENEALRARVAELASAIQAMKAATTFRWMKGISDHKLLSDIEQIADNVTHPTDSGRGGGYGNQ